MKPTFLAIALLALSNAPGAFAAALYDNTTTDTFNTLFFSVGPYAGIGDQIQLTAAAQAGSAQIQFFNLGGAGTFDAELAFYQPGAPVGAQIGGTFTQTGIVSAGLDILDVTFVLGGLALPQDLIFVVSLTNTIAGMDLGLNLFEPPTVGSSDNTFLIVNTGTFAQAVSANENVYFRVNDFQPVTVPEPSTLFLFAGGLAAVAIARLRLNRIHK